MTTGDKYPSQDQSAEAAKYALAYEVLGAEVDKRIAELTKPDTEAEGGFYVGLVGAVHETVLRGANQLWTHYLWSSRAKDCVPGSAPEKPEIEFSFSLRSDSEPVTAELDEAQRKRVSLEDDFAGMYLLVATETGTPALVADAWRYELGAEGKRKVLAANEAVAQARAAGVDCELSPAEFAALMDVLENTPTSH